MKKVKKMRKKNIVLRLCIFIFVAYAAVQLVEMQMDLSAKKQQLTGLQQQYEVQRLANMEMERRLAQGADEEYIERVAREELEFVTPDERVYIDISGN